MKRTLCDFRWLSTFGYDACDNAHLGGGKKAITTFMS